MHKHIIVKYAVADWSGAEDYVAAAYVRLVYVVILAYYLAVEMAEIFNVSIRIGRDDRIYVYRGLFHRIPASGYGDNAENRQQHDRRKKYAVYDYANRMIRKHSCQPCPRRFRTSLFVQMLKVLFPLFLLFELIKYSIHSSFFSMRRDSKL